MLVLKFGGTSVGTADSIKEVLKVIKTQKQKDKEIVVVVSAFSGVTNQLQKLSELAQLRDPLYQDELENIRSRHKQMIADLLGDKAPETEEQIMPLILELAEIIHGTYLLRECSVRSKDLILSFGERLSATIISSFFKNSGTDALFCDARKLILTDDQFGGARINFEQTNKKISQHCSGLKSIQVVTGFIASTKNEVTTTLGRGGSDYTAAVFAAALNATELQIWTDVNGVMTTNPSVVNNAFSLDQLTYEEAMELSHFGAKVLHPPTIQPVLEKDIPIRILNTFDTSFSGTVISSTDANTETGITGLTAIDHIALLTIQGSGMVGVPGVAARLFQALAQKEINVILITQASSEHSICVAVKPEDSRPARKAIEAEFRHEIKAREMDSIKTETDLSVLAVVGRNMRRVPGIAGKLFNALGRENINAVAVTQGSSELNISVVVHNKDQKKALNVIHDAFYPETNNVGLSIFLAGSGLIGAELLKQINELGDKSLKVCGIANSKKYLIEKDRIDLKSWQNQFDKKAIKSGKTLFFDEIKKSKNNKKIFVDCSASEIVSNEYETLLENGISVVTANKIANTQSYKNFVRLQELVVNNPVQFNYETNVGAGLPVIETLKMLLRSGDEIIKIEGILSGSLSYLFNTFKKGVSFSDLVKKAGDLGYLEPDPRVDLGGTDVARKILILARECGVSLELSDIKLKSFLPDVCEKAKTVEAFYAELEKNDAYFSDMLSKANSQDKVLRYIASFKNNSLQIGLQAVDQSHPFYNLDVTDNIVAFTTKRYNKTPLVIKGPGAGAEVTAAGVLADILKCGEIK
ncbi:MAG: bifunctional aspartate kinase/homoserine dehydrogenase I [Calditrichaeota bacterium]|nr:MAG: bifunctional aspartate kinase/homoserine dehydrogenase I [Calditrichota bacterium]MBL1205085.1 bifunctional aspartate kinase/homoserine dehydrogenase I [Calditrichota bacterium]NOG44915.1 bifunctional aspartate kinase/homoserine dehydrogenase I [Calditrichota bacterium]